MKQIYMERFLSGCAKYIYEKHQGELHEICMVFPNRRAGVFFTSYLQEEIDRTVLAPEITTISRLTTGGSELIPGEKIQLVAILYDVFRKHTGTKETFDEFYFWGEILLADFNDIDRYLVNAKDLFSNILGVKQVDMVFHYLTEEQKKAIAQFWGSMAVGTDKKPFREKYLALWDKLFFIYTDFKEMLAEKGIAYSGMLEREMVENLGNGGENYEFIKYYIVGLNTLNSCEKKLFAFLKDQGKAEFLWDYDRVYVEDTKNEAGRFIRENLKNFPPPDDFNFDADNFNRQKTITLAAFSSVYGQSQQIPAFLEETKTVFKDRFDNTAVVLADESLLFAALGAVPEKVETLNVTMGYPVKNSMIYGFVLLMSKLILNRREEGNGETVVYHRFVTDLMNHQLMRLWESKEAANFLDEIKRRNQINVSLDQLDFTSFHKTLFSVPEKVEEYSSYFKSVLGAIYTRLKEKDTTQIMAGEVIHSIYSVFEKLDAVIRDVRKTQKIELSDKVYLRLMSQYMGNVSVAFEGEPLAGIQVMGILETRCLDFENLVILGLNENKWPRTFIPPSFIPFNIRKGFGLPGIDEQDSLYAYYFYRLIQRARNITCTYNVAKDGMSSGELSRYGFQLLYDSKHKPRQVNLEYRFEKEPVMPIRIQSSARIVDILTGRNSKESPLSATAINTYLNCSLQFYFRYVMGLPELDEVVEEIDGRIFGNIFHDVMETIYQPYTGKEIKKIEIEEIRKSEAFIAELITEKVSKHYFKEKTGSSNKIQLNGKILLAFENLKIYVNQVLNIDKEKAPFRIIGLEKRYADSIIIDTNKGNKEIFVGGIIDRVDEVKGLLHVLDYKTGNVSSFTFKEVSELFVKEAKNPKKEILQALVYCWVLAGTINNGNIHPVVYSLRKLFEDRFDGSILNNGKKFVFNEVKESFLNHAKDLLQEIFSTENEFSQTDIAEKCKYCSFRNICQRY